MVNFFQPFWLVWKEGGGVPTYQHPNSQSAENEAARLAQKHPGSRFHILKSESACQMRQPVEWLHPETQSEPDDYSYIPF